MKKNNNVVAIIIIAIIVIAVGLMIYGGRKNKVGTPAVDQHGHPLAANISEASLNELIDKPSSDFILADQGGKLYSLTKLVGKNIVLFFNEGLMCYPACWNQIVSLARDDRFKGDDIVILSVVVDSPGDWQAAIRKMPELAEATVVFDKDKTVSKRFNMLATASSMHYGSFPGHTYILIDKEGVVRYAFDDPSMGIRNDQLAAEIAKLN